jgi:hypothetical protein
MDGKDRLMGFISSALPGPPLRAACGCLPRSTQFHQRGVRRRQRMRSGQGPRGDRGFLQTSEAYPAPERIYGLHRQRLRWQVWTALLF